MNERQAILQANLGEYLQQVSGGPAGVSHMQPLAGGASRETWAVTANLAGREEHLVLRLDMASSMNAAAISRADEFRLLQVAYEQGVHCPRPRWLCTDPAVLGAPFFLMDLVAGESIGTRVVRRPELATARAALPAQIAAQLAHIHAIDPATPGLTFLPRPPAGTSPAQHIINQMRQALVDLQSASPGLTAGLRWLEQHQPPAGALRVLHGDFRVGNLLVVPAGLAAVIDWEFAHLGDPLEDIAWPLVRDWRFGQGHLRLGGISNAEPYLAAYEALTKRPLAREAVTYWEIMGNMKWAVTCLVQAQRHISGRDPSIELASLGRRSAEMELELLTLIAGR